MINNCTIASWWIMQKKRNLQQILVYPLAIIVWVNNFQTPKIQAALSSFFVRVMILYVIVIGVVDGWAQYRSIKWSTKMIENQRSNLGSWWTLLVLTAFQTEDGRHWPSLRDLPSHLSINTRGPWPANGAKARLKAYIGSGKSCHRNQTHDFGARHSEEYDSVLSQQSISGKIVSFILCAWKPGFFKSGHICKSCVDGHLN